MAEIKTGASAQVTMTIEVMVGGAWGAACTVEQVYKQAAEEALGRVRNLAKDGIRVIGEPKVTAILATRER